MKPDNLSCRPCLSCDGRGFLRSGDFYNRTFPKCTACKGVGQFYLEPKACQEQAA